MSFLSPSMLWALPLAAIPLIIYLLMRLRTLKVGWGADYVLLRAIERMRKRLFLDQILLIALRTLAVAALVVAFARPISRSGDVVASGTGTHRVIVVDCSYSMGASAGDATRFERVTAVLDQLAGSWGRNERWSLYVIDEDPGWRVRDAAITSGEEVRKVLAELRPVESNAAIGRALDEVLGVAASGPTEIYIASDDQALSWDDARSVDVPKREDLRLFWIAPEGGDGSGNLAVTAVRAGSHHVLVGHPLRIFVAVRNFGLDPQLEVPVEVLIDGRFAGRETIALQPGQELEAEIDLTFDASGSHRVTARIGEDILAFDNEATVGIVADAHMRVAVLRDPGSEELFGSSYPFLELAARVLAADGGGDLAAYEVLLIEGGVNAANLAGVDCVVLDGGRTVDFQLASELLGFVERGGALVLAAGDGIDAASWNRDLAALDLLPARIGPLQVVPLGAEGAAVPQRGGEAPEFRNFTTTENGDLGKLRFHSWFRLEDPVEEARILLRFADGSPFVVSQRRGPGAVLLLAAGMDGRNANLVARELFHPFVARLLTTAVSEAGDPLTVAAGQPISVHLPPVADLRGATFELVGEQPQAASAVERDGHLVLGIAGGAKRSGAGSFLVVSGSGTERIHIGVQGERVDSDLRALGDVDRQQIADRLGIQRVSGWDQLSELLRTSRQGAERYAWVLIAMLAFMVGELVVARRFA